MGFQEAEKAAEDLVHHSWITYSTVVPRGDSYYIDAGVHPQAKAEDISGIPFRIRGFPIRIHIHSPVAQDKGIEESDSITKAMEDLDMSFDDLAKKFEADEDIVEEARSHYEKAKYLYELLLGLNH